MEYFISLSALEAIDLPKAVIIQDLYYFAFALLYRTGAYDKLRYRHSSFCAKAFNKQICRLVTGYFS